MYPNIFEVVAVAEKKKRIHHFGPVPEFEFANIPGRVTFNDLPSEVIIDIARHVAAGVDRSKIYGSYGYDFPRYNSCFLLQLALCSRRLHHLVEPVLYERFHHGAMTSGKGLQLFLLRILARPDLGRCVKIFHVDDTRAPILGFIFSDDEDDNTYTFTEECVDLYETDFEDVICFTAEGLEAAGRKITEASTTTQESSEWVAGVEKRDLNAMIALILTLTPNLQVLDIDMWTRPDSVPAILTRMLGLVGQLQRERQRGNPLALWGLKKVVVRYLLASDFEIATHHLLSVLTIPSVEILCAIHEEAASNYFFDFPETDVNETELESVLQGNNLGLVNMKELSLSFMLVDPNTLFRLWRCYPGLKKLYYEDRLNDDDNGDNGRFDIDRFKSNNLIAEASRIIPHLQDLTILNQEYTWGSLMESSTMGVLTPFENLRRLEITWPVLACCGDLDEELFTLPTSRTVINAIPRSIK
ncbi:hypothetical protein V502_08788 [Pseudogymnoascus sp. VKM F-4520 (FW-2644)]|nr:hypothetical protein V502_08788 [Pseudogymnoascus sp. VKM F-4520 (FW-2644)]